MKSTLRAHAAVGGNTENDSKTSPASGCNRRLGRHRPVASAACIWRRLASDSGGTIAILSAVSIAALVGFTGLAIDVGVWQMHRRDIQGTADSAAYSAAVAIGKHADATKNAKGITAQMGFVDGVGGVAVAVNTPPTQGKYAGNHTAVEVIVSAPQQSYFSKLYLSSAPTEAASAVGLFGDTNTQYCVLSLDPSASGAVTTWGSSNVDFNNCSLQVDSSNTQALNVGGNGSLTATQISVTGNYTTGNASTLTYDYMSAPGAPRIADPYANVVAPTATCPGYSKNVPTGTVPAGSYCNGMTFNAGASYVLSGTYIVSGSHSCFCVNGGATLTSGVGGATIILTDGAWVKIDSNSTVTLTAPTSGTYSGLVFFQDKLDTQAAILNGGTLQNYTGALYFPGANLTYSGNGGQSQCTQIVALTVTFTGNSTIQSNCTGTGVATITGYSTMVAG